ncbi:MULTISPECIES: hypothetical protein [unclassified Microcoleus]
MIYRHRDSPLNAVKKKEEERGRRKKEEGRRKKEEGRMNVFFSESYFTFN